MDHNQRAGNIYLGTFGKAPVLGGQGQGSGFQVEVLTPVWLLSIPRLCLCHVAAPIMDCSPNKTGSQVPARCICPAGKLASFRHDDHDMARTWNRKLYVNIQEDRKVGRYLG
jgi:hypothetical protein